MQQPPPGYGPPRPGMMNMMQPPMGFPGAPLFNMGPPQMPPPGAPAPRLNIALIFIYSAAEESVFPPFRRVTLDSERSN